MGLRFQVHDNKVLGIWEILVVISQTLSKHVIF